VRAPRPGEWAQRPDVDRLLPLRQKNPRRPPPPPPPPPPPSVPPPPPPCPFKPPPGRPWRTWGAPYSLRWAAWAFRPPPLPPGPPSPRGRWGGGRPRGPRRAPPPRGGGARAGGVPAASARRRMRLRVDEQGVNHPGKDGGSRGRRAARRRRPRPARAPSRAR